MKHIDPVMKELWAAKDANAAKFGTAADYLHSCANRNSASVRQGALLCLSRSAQRASLLNTSEARFSCGGSNAVRLYHFLSRECRRTITRVDVVWNTKA